jgi:hypothetical protein
MQRPPYEKEVLGRRVAIQFLLQGQGKRFFNGTIKQVNMTLVSPSSVVIHHKVDFDDNDADWYDLKVLEKKKTLRWLDDHDKKVAAQSIAVAATPTVAAKPRAKRKDPPSKTQAVGSRRSPRVALAVGGHRTSPPTVADSWKATFPTSIEEINPEPVASVTPEPVASVTPEPVASVTPEPVASMNAVDPQPTDWPTTLADILHYMDEMEPDQKYFARQVDIFGECSRTQSKLQQYAREFPHDPAVAYWARTKSWEPPDGPSLDAIIALIKRIMNRRRATYV